MVVEVEEFDKVSWPSSRTPEAESVALLYDPFGTIHERCDVANTSLANFTSFNVSTIEPGEVWVSLLDMMAWLTDEGLSYVQVPYYVVGTSMTPPSISADGTVYEFQLSTRTRGEKLAWECLNSTWNTDMSSDVCPEQAGRVDPEYSPYNDYLLLEMPPAEVGQ